MRSVQAESGIDPSGTVSRDTWEILAPPLRLGDDGHEVRALQRLAEVIWSGEGETLPVDGAFGPSTQDAVRIHQHRWGLGVDGLVGDLTWSNSQAHRPGVRLWPLARIGADDRGDRGIVNVVQHLLGAHGHPVPVDGVYGPITGAAVRDFAASQRAVYVSDTVGQLDWPALMVTVRSGDASDAVRALQSLSPSLVIDGRFGPATEAAVRRWQTAFRLAVDGVVGPITWHSLVAPNTDHNLFE